MNHLTETQLQGLADGTLRGPEGLAAREHCETCAGCDAELSAYGALVRTLSALQDPPPPLDFTASVLAAVEVRETQLSQRRHTLLASLPAAPMAEASDSPRCVLPPVGSAIRRSELSS